MAASVLTLSRSYYAWIGKIGTESPHLNECLPKVFPTSLNGLKIVSNTTNKKLKNTIYENKSNYWYNLFENFNNSDEFVYNLEEVRLQSIFNRITKWFTPSKQPVFGNSEKVVKDTLHKVLTWAIKQHKEIVGRGEFFFDEAKWLNKMTQFKAWWYDDVVLSSIGIDMSKEEFLKTTGRKALANNLKVLIASFFAVPHHVSKMGLYTINALEYFVGFMLYIATRILDLLGRNGKVEVKKVITDVTANA